MKKSLLFGFLIVSMLLASANVYSEDFTTQVEDPIEREIVLISDVDWQMLNPARGDKSPKAGTLWGDRKGEVPTGFLVEFVDGFSSPPHIHNVTYRGVVISGLVHNDDPTAEKMWMPQGSFWTQPKGELHITAAQGEKNIAFIEIDNGPYLVLPSEEAFDSGERPVNVDVSNVVWTNHSNSDVKTATLWGVHEAGLLRGSFVKLPKGFSGWLNNHGSIFRLVVIEGELQVVDKAKAHDLSVGSYLGTQTAAMHQLSTAEGATVYIRTNDKFDVN